MLLFVMRTVFSALCSIVEDLSLMLCLIESSLYVSNIYCVWPPKTNIRLSTVLRLLETKFQEINFFLVSDKTYATLTTRGLCEIMTSFLRLRRIIL